MLRSLLLVGCLGLVGYGVFQWAKGGPNPVPNPRPQGEKPTTDALDRDRDVASAAAPSEDRKETRLETRVSVVASRDPARQLDPLVILDARIGPVDYPEVSSQRNGKILFLEEELDKEEPGARKRIIPLTMIETTAEERQRLKLPGYTAFGKEWRELQEGEEMDSAPEERPTRLGEDVFPPSKEVRTIPVLKYFRPLHEEMPVTDGRLIGLIDPALARADMEIKIAKLQASESDLRAAVKTRDEARIRYDYQKQLKNRGGATSEEEVRGAELTWHKYIEEAISKRASVKAAQKEINNSQVVLKQHEIRAPITGVVRRLYKQVGESVRGEQQQEPILRIEGTERLRVEGFVELQDARRLKENMPVVVEPNRPEGPSLVLAGHREAITAIAVSRGTEPRVVSASEDRTVRIWKLSRDELPMSKGQWRGEELWRLEYPAVVRSLSCTGKDAARNLCLTGSADGVVRLWDLDKMDDQSEPLLLKEAHRGPILATAFSADGKWCATGGEDKSVCLWNTETGELTQRIREAHRGQVTSLAFTPKGQLVSAGRDNRMVLRTVTDGKAELVRDIDQRAGNVETLGLNADGSQVLFDQGSRLRVLELADWSTRGVLRNPLASVNFTTFALFSPDGKMVLTAGSSENRLQLWNNPVGKRRASELRQYIWADGASTCAAFDPLGAFAVTGTRDRQILIWNLPKATEADEVEDNGFIRNVVESLDSSSRQLRIVVDLKSKQDRLRNDPDRKENLIPGDKATIVIYPK